ncbi:VanW family protein [Rubrobacter aplysinae]|uniref:VanW family protein n=1 Tax=Rubrobacter aplysinae TaxID=909625 RepID=UPI000A473BCA|nr:VanW family protein [Rubrobacter aplysinae]
MGEQANSTNSTTFKRKYRRRRSRNRLVLLLATALLVVLAAVVLLGVGSTSADEIPRGVQAGGIDLGGKTTGEAERILEERAYALNEVRVSGDGKEVTIPASSLGVRPEVEATVENAQQVGREGGVLERVGERANGFFGTVEVPLEVAYSDEQVRSQARSLATQLDEEPTQAGVTVSGGGADGVQVSQSAKGYEVDVRQTAANIRGAIQNLEGEAGLAGGATEPGITTAEAEAAAGKARNALGGPAVLAAQGEEWELTPDQIAAAISVEPENGKPRVQMDEQSLRSGLDDMYSSVNAKAKEAGFRFADGGVEVVPGRVGQAIQSQKLLGSLESGLLEGQRRYEVPVAKDVPSLTTREARQQRPTQMIGKYRTSYRGTGDDSQARVNNLEVAGGALTGQTVAPDEIFSVNDVLAPVDYEKASTFVDGEKKEALGGGLCQVASTLYMAVNYAGLEPVERHPHYALLNYVRPGFDSTVWFGAENGYSGQELDMKFRNTSEGYVMIREYVADDGYLYAEVWGQPTGREVTMDSTNLVENENISKWKTTKTVENAGGETTFSGELHTDTYNALSTDHGKLPPDEVDVAPVNP